MKTYAGIGNRLISFDTFCALRTMAQQLAKLGWALRTGGADGSDKAFEQGAAIAGGDYVVYRPKDATEEARLVAARFHPYWFALKPYTQNLMARNAQIILGLDLQQPVDTVFVYTVNEEEGGSAFAMRVARAYKIPVLNLATPMR